MSTEHQENTTRYSAALYMRLSKDDEGTGESSSIMTQRKMLTAYAKANHYPIYSEYVDDGFSGTNFDRPAFKRMIADIERRKVNLVLTKDLSRLGRDYILSGQYTELYFPAKRVRYIAINDGYDSDSPYTDIAPFRNVVNELYARDTSKKIRSALRTRMSEGLFVSPFAPYGYRRDPDDRHHLIVDEEAAKTVRYIYQEAAHGTPPIQIARALNASHTPTPLEYRYASHPEGIRPTRREWTSGTITKILKNMVYLGHLAQGKTTKVSFKSKLVINNPQSSWCIVPNTHQPIVSQELFDLAARRSRQRTCVKKGRFQNLFSGLAKCADCGRGMSTVGTRKKGAVAVLACGGYKRCGSQACSNHFIDYSALYHIILTAIKSAVQLSTEEERQIIATASARLTRETRDNRQETERQTIHKRLRELDRCMEKVYDDYGAGILRADRLEKLLAKYEAESTALKERLQTIAHPLENGTPDLVQLLRSLSEPESLSQDVLYKLIDHIEIGQGVYEKTEVGMEKHQAVNIYFRFRPQAATNPIVLDDIPI